VYAEKGLFGQRVAHGLLVVSVVTGLVARTGILDGTVIAFREINHWKFSRPVFLGDTIHAELTVKETKLMRRLGGGNVMIQIRVKNQSGDVVMSGIWAVLMMSKPA